MKLDISTAIRFIHHSPTYADFDTDAFNKLTEQLFGYSTYGYLPRHNTEESVKHCDEHVR